jgi:hypothetical protein
VVLPSHHGFAHCLPSSPVIDPDGSISAAPVDEAVTKAVRPGIKTECEMGIPDFNQTVVLTIALLVSLNRLVRLIFASLRLCIREYCAFRIWLRARRRGTGNRRSVFKDVA